MLQSVQKEKIKIMNKNWLHLNLRYVEWQKKHCEYIGAPLDEDFFRYFNAILKIIEKKVERFFYLQEKMPGNVHIYLAFEIKGKTSQTELFYQIKQLTLPHYFEEIVRIENNEKMPEVFINLLFAGTLYACWRRTSKAGYYNYDEYKAVHCLLNQLSIREFWFHLNTIVMTYWGSLPKEIRELLRKTKEPKER